MEPAPRTASEGSQDSTRMSSFIDFDGKSGAKDVEERTLAKATVPLSGAARKAMIEEVSLHVANQPGKQIADAGNRQRRHFGRGSSLLPTKFARIKSTHLFVGCIVAKDHRSRVP